jgi:hypothetical protein
MPPHGGSSLTFRPVQRRADHARPPHQIPHPHLTFRLRNQDAGWLSTPGCGQPSPRPCRSLTTHWPLPPTLRTVRTHKRVKSLRKIVTECAKPTADCQGDGCDQPCPGKRHQDCRHQDEMSGFADRGARSWTRAPHESRRSRQDRRPPTPTGIHLGLSKNSSLSLAQPTVS